MTAHRLAVLAVALALLAFGADARAAALGERCGGFVGIKCDGGMWCQRPAGQCSGTDRFGTCARIPQVCAKIYRPVCGCDGKSYGNDCERQAAQTQLAHAGPCR